MLAAHDTARQPEEVCAGASRSSAPALWLALGWPQSRSIALHRRPASRPAPLQACGPARAPLRDRQCCAHATARSTGLKLCHQMQLWSSCCFRVQASPTAFRRSSQALCFRGDLFAIASCAVSSAQPVPRCVNHYRVPSALKGGPAVSDMDMGVHMLRRAAGRGLQRVRGPVIRRNTERNALVVACALTVQ